MDKFVINIGRKLGSGGRAIGERLASRLGIAFYDKELIRLASEESGLCCEVFEKADERPSSGMFGSMYSARFPFISDGAMPTNCLSNDALFKVQSDVIREIADKHSALFVGRCADYILRERKHVVNLFITAPDSYRIKVLCERHAISPRKAVELMEKVDKTRAEYYNYYSDKTWGAAESYDLCIDSSLLGLDETVLFIEEFVRKSLNR